MRVSTSRIASRLLLAAAAWLATPATTSAATLYWDGTSSTGNADGGAGTWNTTNTNWDSLATAGVDSTWSNVTPDDAVFGGTAGTVTLGATMTAGTLTFNTAGYTLARGGFNLSATSLAGTGAVTFTGAGTVSISGASSGYSGNITLGPGSAAATEFLTVGNNASLGSGTLNMRGGILQASAANLNLANAIDVAAGGFRVGGTNSFTLSGNITVDATSRTFANYSSNASLVTLSGGITTVAGTTVSFDNASGAATGAPITVSGAITGAGALGKTGAGTVTLSGNNTFTGNINVSAGTLKVSGAGAHLYNGGFNNSSVITISGTGILELDSFAYQGAGGTGQLADYGARRVLNGGTINVVGSGHSSGNNFNVANGGSGTFNYNGAAGQTLTLSGNGNSNIAVGGTLTFGGTGNITVNETIDANVSNGSIVYAGSGTLQFGTLQGLNSVTTLTARTGGTIRLAATNLFVSGHGVALAANRSIAAEGTGSVVFAGDFRVGNLTLNNGGTITSNVAVGGYGVLLADNAGGASTVTVSGTYASAARMNGSGGMNMQGVQNFAVADINTTATDSGQDLIVAMALGNPNSSGGAVGGITKSGAGTMALTNTGNTFSGAVTVNAGTLLASGASGNTNTSLGLSSGSRAVTVNNGGTLLISGNNVFGGNSQTLANTIKVVVNAGGILTTNAYNVIGNVDLNGATMTATAGSNGSYNTWEFNGSTVTVGGSAASTISSSAASNGSYHLGGNRTLTLDVADATSSSATDLTVSAVFANGSNDRAGNGALLKTGAGTVLFSANNSYSGGLTVRAGSVVVSNAGGLGAGTVTLNDASTSASNSAILIDSTSGGVTVSRDITVAAQGNGTTTLGSVSASGSNASVFSGTITINKDVVLSGGPAGDRLGFSGNITGAGNVTVAAGVNRVLFTGLAKTYSGTTTVNSGAIFQLSDGSSTAVDFLPNNSSVTVNGTLRLAKGTNSETIGGLAGVGIVESVAGTNTLILGSGDATATFGGTLRNSGATLALTKTGAGTQNLSGTSSYTGATAVNAGTLALTGSGALGNTAITVANGAAFTSVTGTSAGGSLTVDAGGSATLGGSLAGALGVSGSVTLSAGGTVAGTTTVANGATLRGFGTAGAVNVQTGGKLVAGDGTTGTLTVGALTFAGTATVDIGTFTNYASSAAIAAGALTASGAADAVTLNLGGGGAVNGAYNLISFTGSGIGGTGLGAFVLGTKPTTSNRQTATLRISGNNLQYLVSGATPYWTGLQSSSWGTATVGGDGNWKLDTDNSVAQYEATDAVLFNDSATNTTATIDQADLTPTSVTVTGSKNFTFDGAFGITSGLIVKSGSGSLTILNANAFSGGTTVTGGRIRAGTDTALGQGVVALNGGALSSDSTATRTLANPLTIGAGITLGDATDNGALVLNGTVGLGGANRTLTLASDVTLGGKVSSGGITKAGSGTLTLSGANDYAGGTAINAGTVVAGSVTAFGSAAVTVGGGTLDLNGQTIANAVTFNSGSIVANGGIGGNLDLGGNTLTASVNSTLTLGGTVSNGGITKSGNGALVLSGSNSYSGTTTLAAGTIRAGSNTALGSGALALNGGRLSSNGSTARSLANAVTLGGAVSLGDATNNGALTLAGTVNLGGDNALTVDSAVTFSDAVSNGTLRKGGAGTLTLSGSSTYAGGTVVTNGVLEFATVSDSAASNLGSSGALTIEGGTLRYTGAGSATTTRALNFNVGAAAIDVSQAAGTLVLNPASGTRNRSFTKTGAGTLDLSGAIGGAGTLTVANGTLILRSAHSFTGETVINSGGTLRLSTTDFTRALATSGITVNTGGTLAVTATNVLYDGSYAFDETPITVNGGTVSLSYTVAGSHQHLGTLNLNGGTLTGTATAAPYSSEYSTFDRAVTVGGSSRSVISAAQSTYTYALNMQGMGRGANVFNVASTGDASGVDLLVSAILSNSASWPGVAGSLRKTGAGTMSLTAGNTYTGATVVDAGVLLLARANSANGTLAGAVTVNSGGELRLGVQDALGYTSGRGAVTVNAGGTLRIVTGFRSTLANNLTLNGGTVVGAGSGDTWGHISLFNGSGVVATSDASGNAAVINALVGLQDSGGLTTFNVSRGVASPVSDLNVTGRLVQMNGSTNGMRKSGGGVMTLSGTNTFVGGTTVDAGTLSVAAGGRLYHGGYYGSAASVVTVNSGGILELQNWGYGETTQSLGGLNAMASAFVINGGTVRIVGTQATSYGRGVTVNAGGATLEAATGANWTVNTVNDSNAWVYNGNPRITFAGAGNGVFDKALNLGTGGVTKNGAGTWTLSAANSFSGDVQINDGTLLITDAGALGTGAVIVSGGYLDLNGLNPTNAITLAGGQLLRSSNWAPASVTVAGAVSAETINALTGTVTLGNGASVNLAAVTKNLVITGAPTLTGLASYAGALSVGSGGTLNLSAGDPSGQITLAAGGTVDFGSRASDKTIKFGGGTVTGANFTGYVEIDGGTSESPVALGSGIQAGKVRVTAGNVADIQSGFSRDIAYAGGTLTGLSADYSGKVTLETGALYSVGVTTGATFELESGSTLKGDGFVGALTQLSGSVVAPGNSPGLLSVTGDYVLSPGATFEVEIENPAALRGTGYDAIDVGGNLNLSALGNTDPSTRFTLKLIKTGVFELAAGTEFQLISRTFLIEPVGYTGNITEYFTVDTSQFLDAQGSPIDPTWFQLTDSAGMLRLTYTPVPEPSTYGLILGGLALAGAAVRRRRKAGK